MLSRHSIVLRSYAAAQLQLVSCKLNARVCTWGASDLQVASQSWYEVASAEWLIQGRSRDC